MTWLFEDATPVLILGGLVEVGLIVAFFQTGLTRWLWAAVAVAAVVAGVWTVERLVVTENEEIENMVYAVAVAAEVHDVPRMLDFISPTAREIRSRAEGELSRYRLKQVRIRGLEIKPNKLTSPPSARVNFVANIDIADARGGMLYERFPLPMSITVHREAAGWRLTDYSYDRDSLR